MAQEDGNAVRPSLQTEPAKKRFSFLKNLRHGSHRHANGDSPSPSTPNGNGTEPGGTPMKRATAPPTTPTREHSFAGKPLSSPPQWEIPSRPLPNGIENPERPAAASPPRSAMRSGSNGQSGATSPSFDRMTSDGSVETTGTSVTNDEGDAKRSESKSGVRFADPYNDDDDRPRPRRMSSGAISRRRSSIYFKQTEGGDYLEGVDAGAGSKARRLSVKIPAQLEVDECRLEEHFTLFNRMGKKKIGEGGAAAVQLMQSKTAGSTNAKTYAVKEFRDWDAEEEEEQEYIRKIKSEYAIAKSCENPHIVQTFRLCTSGKNWFHVMEYCELGDLNDLIKANYMDQEDKNCMFKQLLRGVEYLHARGLAHRDIKSENLLVTASGCLKIADFGTSEVFCGQHPGLRHCRRPSIISQDQDIRLCQPGMVGSRPYMAPEIYERKADYDPRCVDAWSCGIVYLSLCFGGTPWDAAHMDAKNYHAFRNSYDTWHEQHPGEHITKTSSLPKIASSSLFNLRTPFAVPMAIGLLDPTPSLRWSVKEALEIVCDREGYGPWPCCQQEGYSDDLAKREKRVMHKHQPPKVKKSHFGK
jgi:protein-serine/threonine kinase